MSTPYGERTRGYFPFVAPGLDLEETLRHAIGSVRREAEALGRDPSRIEMTVGGARSVEGAERFARLGVDRLVIAVRGKEAEEIREELGRFAEEVIAQTRDL